MCMDTSYCRNSDDRSLSLITYTCYSTYKPLQALRVTSTNEISPSFLVISECLITQIGDEN